MAQLATPNETCVPVRTECGSTYLPVDRDATPTYLIVVKREKKPLLDTRDPNGDRVCVGALTLAEAVGMVLMANPALTYNDVLDHMEV